MSVTVHFVTNRNHIPENAKALFGGRFNPDGVASLRFGKAEFDVTGQTPLMNSITVFDETLAVQPAAGFVTSGSNMLLTSLHEAMAVGKRDTVVFIHGFNVTFMEALKAGARLGAELANNPNIIVFSWPSDGTMVPFMSYYSDREDARASGPALARTYLKLLDFVAGLDDETRCRQALHIVAHSMGAYVLRQGLQAICAKDSRRLVRLFDQIILAAPDEDDDAFETDEKLKKLPMLGRRVTVYFNRNDRALLVSDSTKTNPDRLGSDGPRMLDLLPKKVIVVDCYRIAARSDPVVQHSYYINNSSVSADLRATLADTESRLIENREMVRPEFAFRLSN